MQHSLELISFALCPYVQRAVIMLNMKKIDYKTTFIDLESPPAWFDKISPLGQVPVLRIDEQHVIFESSVICELLDELYPPRFHLQDAILRAKERAWMEYGAALIADHSEILREKNVDTAVVLKNRFRKSLARVEEQLQAGPLFRGTDFSLVDATFAPTFMRMSFIPEVFGEEFLSSLPKVQRWSEHLNTLPEVISSVILGYRDEYRTRIQNHGSALFLTEPDRTVVN